MGESRRRRLVLVVGVLVVVGIAFVVGLHIDANTSRVGAHSGTADLVLPDRVGDLHAVQDALVTRLGAQIDAGAAPGQVLIHRGYRAASGVEVIVVGLSARGSAANRDYLSTVPPIEVLTAFDEQAGVDDPAQVDPGARGGLMSCGHITAGAASTGLCAWVDDATFGAVIDTSAHNGHAALSTADLTDVTRSVRAAAERG